MSKEREALKLTLEALKKMESRFGCESSRAEEQPKTFACHHMAETCPRCEGLVSGWKAVQAANQAIAAAEKALSQPEQKHWGSYVYGRVFVGNLPEHVRKLAEDEGVAIQLLYTIPPQRKLLTFDEVEDCFPDGGGSNEYGEVVVSPQWLHDFAAAIQRAAHNIKE